MKKRVYHHDHHGEAAPANLSEAEKSRILLAHMLDHNRHHADELHDICHSLEDAGKAAAAEKLAEALHYFDHCNEYLAEAVELAKGE